MIDAALTRERHDAIVDATRKGRDLDKAAEEKGLEPALVRSWVRRGQRRKTGIYAEFARDINEAAAELTSTVVVARIVVPRLYRPHPAQRRFHRATRRSRHCAACAGRRGGKTQAGAATMSARMYDDLRAKLEGRERWDGHPHRAWVPQKGKDPQPFLRYAVVAPTYALLDEPKIALRREIGLAAEGGLIVHQTDHVWWLVGGIRIDFLSGDTPARLVSHGYDGVWFEEGARLKRDVWVENMQPTLADTQGWTIWTTTPLGRNWFWEEIWARGNDEAAKDLAALRGVPVTSIRSEEFGAVAWTTADNTAVTHLAAEMELARQQLPEAQFKRNYKADFDAFEGQCFDLDIRRHFGASPEFNRDELIANMTGGMDLGQTHPTSFSLTCTRVDRGAKDSAGRDGIVYELHTERDSQVDFYSDDAWARRLTDRRSTWANRLWWALYDRVGDAWRRIPIYLPADRADVKRAFERYGFRVLDAFQSHEPAVTWFSIAVHNGRVRISSQVLWRCLVAIRYPAPGEVSTKLWVDKDDDEWDGLRYALTPILRLGRIPTPARLTAMVAQR